MEKQQHKDEKNPLVSIIIGNYNYERFLKEAIDSALNQTYQNIEVIIVDDGSKDKSREIISSYGERIIPVFKENGGQPSNYNAGFTTSRGDIICFLDSDDIFLPHKVAEAVNIFESYEEIAWCFHSVSLIDEKGNPLNLTTTPNYISRECDFRARIKAGRMPPNFPPSSALCFRRSVLEKILPMPTTKATPGSDHYVKLMAAALSKGFILGNDLTLQRIHGSNMGTLRGNVRFVRVKEYTYTGLWIRQEFPSFRRFANKLVSGATAFNWITGNDTENIKTIKNYLSSSSIVERLDIYLRAVYYYVNSLILER
ncbi:MAG: glycosyltransferase [Fischerella sp.]|uniref:glycosyltransferase n=1 Tax=Fischerella sp. TaxID=1191 RepID=UPI0017C5FC75|nr:glycosyltransferase [Fischerella sp.]NWF57763.1 glycosyltransferase [Fischerella sp.]